MLMFLAMLLVVLIGVALAIFGVVAALAGVVWLLWPLLVIAGILIAVGYLAGSKKKGKPVKGNENGNTPPKSEEDKEEN